MYFLFIVRHLEFRKLTTSDDIFIATDELGVVKNEGVAVGILFPDGNGDKLGVILPVPCTMLCVKCPLTAEGKHCKHCMPTWHSFSFVINGQASALYTRDKGGSAIPI